MRHGISGRKLNRTGSHRKLLLRNLSASLIESERIETTLLKAKELRPYIEKLVTLAKDCTLSTRRRALSVLQNSAVVDKLFAISERFKDRPGGYTRVLKHGFRAGDAAPLAIISFVDVEINGE